MNATDCRTAYTVIVDTRESLPYPFAGLLTDDGDGDDPFDPSQCDAPGEGYDFAAPLTTRRKAHPLTVQRRVATLRTGDYSIDGHQDRIACERKSLSDLYTTLGQGRARFIRELERLNAMDFAAVVVEAEWLRVATDPPSRSRLNPKTVIASVVAWQIRYSRVHWCFLPGRAVAATTGATAATATSTPLTNNAMELS